MHLESPLWVEDQLWGDSLGRYVTRIINKISTNGIKGRIQDQREKKSNNLNKILKSIKTFFRKNNFIWEAKRLKNINKDELQNLKK